MLSIFTLLLQEVPNSDAYTYARTAEIFLADGIVAAYQHYAWATYSILIGVVSLSGLKVLSAGLFVNALFYALLIYAFLSIIKEINDSKPFLAIAAICILVYPQLNEYRGLLIRDIGFLALSLSALWQYLLYAKTQSLNYAVVFCACLLLATLFRIEALVYLLLIPFALLFDTRFDTAVRSKLLVRIYAILLSTSASLLLLLTLLGLDITQLLIDFVSTYKPFITERLLLNNEQGALLSALVFPEHAVDFSREYIELFLFAGLFSILLANLFAALGGPYLLILIIGLFNNHLRLNREVAIPVIFGLCINFLILLGFIIITRYLSSRYAILMGTLLVLFIPGIVFHILENARASGRKYIVYAIVAFFCYCAIDSYYSFGESKSYVMDSIEWIEKNTSVSSALITNSPAIAYFSGKVEDYDLVKENLTEKEILLSKVGDTIAAELTVETKELLDSNALTGKLKLLEHFPYDETRGVAIFERIDERF